MKKTTYFDKMIKEGILEQDQKKLLVVVVVMMILSQELKPTVPQVWLFGGTADGW